MNFQTHDPDTTSAPDAAGHETDENVTMPLGTGEESALDLGDLSGDGGRKFNSGALLIVAVAVVAAIGLFSMRTLTRASASATAPEQIEKSIDEFLNIVTKAGEERANRTSVLDVLSESYATRQVPLEDVQRNPFIIFEERREVEVVDPRASEEVRQRARRSQFEAAASRLRVGMIVTGSTPMANINGKIARVGDLVPLDPDVSFRVVAISPDRVDFVAEDEALGVRVERAVTLRRE